MAQSKHRAVRAAVAALLQAGTPVSARIFENRDYTLPVGVLNQVHVNFAGSEPQRAAIAGAPIDWTTDVDIVIKARRTNTASAEDAADALWTDIYARVMAAQQLSGAAQYLDPGACEVVDGQADTDVCTLSWRISVTHDTANNTIAAP